MTDVRGGGLTDRWKGEGGGKNLLKTAAACPALEKRAARRRVRLSEKARGAAVRLALCKSAPRGGASGSLKKRAAQRRVRLSERARGAAARPAL